jgi:hypothetical protein
MIPSRGRPSNLASGIIASAIRADATESDMPPPCTAACSQDEFLLSCPVRNVVAQTGVMRTLKLLVACSSLDLDAPFSATPAWWQLLKALDECGVEVLVTTYHGRTQQSPWWRSYPNPARTEGELYALLRTASRWIQHAVTAKPASGRRNGAIGWLTLAAARTLIAPKWERHLARILRLEGDVDGLLLVAIPPNHLPGVARRIHAEFGIPVCFYDGDCPASLPAYGGFKSGFDIYQGADLGEFDLVLSNSKGAEEPLRQLGARSVHTLYYAADPALFQPLPCSQDIDVFFYGHTTEYRQHWMRAMLAEPAARMPDAVFATRGVALGHLDGVRREPYRSFSSLRRYIARSRINLVIVRQPHAQLHASSILRPFELAMMGACMVCNPWSGIEEWFEPDKEIIVVGSAEEAIDRYRYLLSHDPERTAIGQAARKRALEQHTYKRRAQDLMQTIQSLH